MCTMTPRASVCKRQIRVSEILKVKTFDLIQLLGLLELFLLTGFAHCIIQSCVFCFLTIVYERLCTEWKWTGCQTKVSICSVLCVNYKLWFLNRATQNIISWERTRLEWCLEKLSIVSVVRSLCKRLNVFSPFWGLKDFISILNCSLGFSWIPVFSAWESEYLDSWS